MSFVALAMDVMWDEAEHLHSLRNMVPCYLLMEMGDNRDGFVCTHVLSSEQG